MATNDLSTLPGTTRIAFLNVNPKKPNTLTYARFQASIGAMTLAQLRARPAASTDSDIYFGAARHYITVENLIPPPLIVDKRATCPACHNVYTVKGPNRPEPVWACGHRVCNNCQARRSTEQFDRHERETCPLCYRPVDRLNAWL